MFQKAFLSHSRPVRFAIIGCGRISLKHFQAIQSLPKTEAVVQLACDNDKRKLDAVVKEFSVRGVSSIEEVLQADDVDVVSLCTPSGLHAAQGMLVAQARKHVVTEKPMATNWRDGKRLVQTCDEAGVHLFVVKQNRCNPTLRALKQAISEKRFGRIYMVNINVFWNRPQEYYDSAQWRGTWEFDGGALMNQASHYVDLLDWLIGPIESVQAFTATLARNIQVEDTGVISVRWRSGALGSVNVTMLTHNKNFEGSITILGEKGTVRLGGVALNKVEHWEFESSSEHDKTAFGVSYQPDSVYGNGHTPYYENVVRALRGATRDFTDGREGLKSLEVLIASYISARDGRRVSLPLDY